MDYLTMISNKDQVLNLINILSVMKFIDDKTQEFVELHGYVITAEGNVCPVIPDSTFYLNPLYFHEGEPTILRWSGRRITEIMSLKNGINIEDAIVKYNRSYGSTFIKTRIVQCVMYDPASKLPREVKVS